jgi:magnesium transporter
MKISTVISTMLLPVAIILSFFGTSFEGLPLYSETAFWVMIGSIALVITLALLVFRRWGWI